MPILALLAILVATFLMRLLPRLVIKDAIGSDSYFHLAMARDIRNNNHKLPRMMPRMIIPYRYDYPFFYHWLLSLFSKEAAVVIERITSPFVYTLYVFCTFMFVKAILNCLNFYEGINTIALWSSLLVSAVPPLLWARDHPRGYMGSPRPLGQLFFMIHMNSQIIFSLSRNPYWLLISVFAMVPLTVSSKFANQVALFFGLLLCLFGIFLPLVATLCGFLLAGLITRGAAFHVISGQIKHSIFYCKYVQQRFLYPVKKNMREYLSGLRGVILRSISRPRRFIYWFFKEDYYLHTVLSLFPHMIITAFLFIARYELLESNRFFRELFFALGPWWAVSLVCMLATAIKPLLFLGDSVRYAEYTLIPQILIFTAMAVILRIPILLFAVFIYSVIAYLVNIRIYFDMYRQSTCIYNQLLPLLKKIDREGVKIYSMGFFSYPTLYGTEKATVLFVGGNNSEGFISGDEWNMLCGNMPYPGVKIKRIVDKYDMDYVVTDKSSTLFYEKLLNDDSFTKGAFNEIGSSGAFRIYGMKN